MHLQHLYFPDFSGFFIALQVRQWVLIFLRNIVAVMYSNLFVRLVFCCNCEVTGEERVRISICLKIGNLEDVESFHDICLGFLDFFRLWMRRSIVLPSCCQKWGRWKYFFAMYRSVNQINFCIIGTIECINSKQRCTCGEDVCFVSKNFEIQIFKTWIWSVL